MIAAYINYPNPHVTVHAAAECARIQQHRKTQQRVLKLTASTLSSELERCESKHYPFGADQSTNDMWLHVDFGDPEFERAVVAHILRILASHYRRFARVVVDEHC
jgi:hypothetical protein